MFSDVVGLLEEVDFCNVDPGLYDSVDLRIQTCTEPDPLKYGKLATRARNTDIFTGYGEIIRFAGASIPMGQGEMFPQYYEGGTSMVMSPQYFRSDVV